MRRLFPDQLPLELSKGLKQCYLLCGNDPLLQQESQQAICQVASKQGFIDHHLFSIEAKTDWAAIEATCRSLNLFANQRIVRLSFPEVTLTAAQSEQLAVIATLLHPHLLLMIVLPRYKKVDTERPWFKTLAPQTHYVACQTPETHQLPQWLRKRCRTLGLQPDDAVVQQLCYHYEGNLLALAQLLEQLIHYYPEGILTLPRVNPLIHDASHFTANDWLNALLLGQAERVLHIQQQLNVQGIEPLLLLRTLQPELLLLLDLKRQLTTSQLYTLFEQHRVWPSRRTLFTQTLQRLSYGQLQQALRLLAQLERKLKSEGDLIQQGLSTLSLLICGCPLPEALLNG